MTASATACAASLRSGERVLPSERQARPSGTEPRSPPLYRDAIEHGNLCTGCRMAVELVGMLEAVGNFKEADALFFGTSKFGGAAGLYQIFLREGASSVRLLEQACRRAEEQGSLDRELLSIIHSVVSRRRALCTEDLSEQHDGVNDALTHRERDVLGKICEGFPNKRIARALGISPETVKSHVKRIFMKLAVSTRAQAVSHAKSLGLV